ncbi:hypothetical protein D3C72_2448770 [compost metagenome]
MARYRQALGERRKGNGAAKGVAILHAVGILDQHLLHIETGFDLALNIGDKGRRAQ